MLPSSYAAHSTTFAKHYRHQKCENKIDKVDIGGSSGLDSYDMEKTSTICGKTGDIGKELYIMKITI